MQSQQVYNNNYCNNQLADECMLLSAIEKSIRYALSDTLHHTSGRLAIIKRIIFDSLPYVQEPDILKRMYILYNFIDSVQAKNNN